MWNIAICDVDTAFAAKLEEKLQAFYQRHDFEISIKIYTDPEFFISNVDEPMDLIFINTRLGSLSGYALAELFRGRPKKQDSFLIFVGSNDEDVFEAFLYQPFSYLRMSTWEIDLQKSLGCLWEYDHRNRSIWVRKNRKRKLIRVSDIIYMESQGHYVNVHCVGDVDFHFRERMSHYEELLKGYYFVHSTKSFLVNCAHIKDIEEKVLLSDGRVAPCSKSRKLETEAMWERYMKEVLYTL